MKIVRIIRNVSYPPYFRQTPGRSGIWNGIRFTEEEIFECDYLIVFNQTIKEYRIKCPKKNIWLIHHEPPNEYFRTRHKYPSDVYAKIFTPDSSLKGSKYRHTQTAIPWQIGKNYDFLKSCNIPEKKKILSFITSAKKNFKGHNERLRFLESIRNGIKFDLLGYGFREIKDKWDALAPYKYSLIVENFSGPNYWSEKLADCLLSFTLPIYYGCTNLNQYFPDGSYIPIDIKSDNITGQINKIINSDIWEKNIKKIGEARKLILDKYQFFPFISEYIKTYEKQKNQNIKKERVNIPNENTVFKNIKLKIKRIIG